jgi:hypothetical protein
MDINQEDQIVPEWTTDSGIDFWEPEELYMEWLGFLYRIWQSVEYL